MLELVTLRNTAIKRTPTVSYKELPADQYKLVGSGTIIRVKDLLTYERSHLKLLGSDDTIWWAYAPHVEMRSQAVKQVAAAAIVKPSRVIVSGVEGIYRSQRDNKVRWWAACNATSYAMAFLRHGMQETPGTQLEDEFYQWMLSRGLNPESHPDLVWACEEFSRLDGTAPLRARFVPNATRAQIEAHLDADKVIVTAGYTTGSGHIFLIVGYDANGLYCLDPWGKCIDLDHYDHGLNAGNLVHYGWGLLKRAHMFDGDWFATFIEEA